MTVAADNRAPWDTLLHAVRHVHQTTPELCAFCRFPDDVTPQDVVPYDIPAAHLLVSETGLISENYAELRDAFVAAGPLAHWRETYKGTDIGQDFMDRFACYCLIGAGGAFTSQQMCAWVVYMPPRLHYPWHHHPGEEMYLTLAGEAEFMREGHANKVLRPGQTSQHASNQPHAMETYDHPVMAYVVWRNGFETPPVLT
jgi:quercetin dioxygenase-like cupin family protein